LIIVRYWPEADMPKHAIDVAFGDKAEHGFLLSAYDPGGLQWRQSPISCLQKTRTICLARVRKNGLVRTNIPSTGCWSKVSMPASISPSVLASPALLALADEVIE